MPVFTSFVPFGLDVSLGLALTAFAPAMLSAILGLAGGITLIALRLALHPAIS